MKMNAMETRKLAQELGFKNVAKFSKVELEAMIAAKQAEIAAEEAAKTRRAPRNRIAPVGKCGDCGRKADPNSPSDNRMCTAHLTEAEHENEHMNGHEGFGGEDENFTNDQCWICHPTLNETKSASTAKGTSRVGMRMTVPVRGAATEKVAAVQAKLAALPADEVSVVVSFVEGEELVEMGIMYGPIKIVLAWNSATGAYSYEHTQIQPEANARVAKARNVSAALRVLGL
jgi:hypothetical protein